MSNQILVICDQEEGYLAALSTYLAGRKELALQVMTCNSLQGVKDIQEELSFDYLLISARYEAEERKKITAKKVFVLITAQNSTLNPNETAIFKYQPGDAILSEFMKACSADVQAGELLMKAGRKTDLTVIGVFSPVHRIGKTTYALELGQKRSGKANTLYLNMELYGGCGGIFPEGVKQTLSDVLYYSRQESRNLNLFLTTMTEQLGTLDYVAPAAVSEDIRAVTAKEWTSLIEQIGEGSFYESMILDLDAGLQGIYEILALCTEVHVLTARQPQAQAKLTQFEEELQLLGYGEVQKKLIYKEQAL